MFNRENCFHLQWGDHEPHFCFFLNGTCTDYSPDVKMEAEFCSETLGNLYQAAWPYKTKKQTLHGLSPRANYTDRATAACRRSDCQLVRIEGATWSAWLVPTAVFLVFYTEAATFLSSSSSVVLTRLSGPVPDPLLFFLVVPGIEPGPPDL
jgi:hypothetical protein